MERVEEAKQSGQRKGKRESEQQIECERGEFAVFTGGY
jgi:hypothetical protein